jgi:hypothetical protein
MGAAVKVLMATKKIDRRRLPERRLLVCERDRTK